MANEATASTQINTDVGATAATAEAGATSTEETTADSSAATTEATASDDATVVEDVAAVQADGETTTEADSGDETGETEQTGAPETYEAFTMPEGMQVDQPLVDAFVPIAKELNISQENAQRLATMFAEHQQASSKAFMDNFSETQKGWQETMNAWPESAKVIADAKKVLESDLAPEGFRQLVNGAPDSWLGNHPDVVRFLANVAPLIKEDSFLDGKTKGVEKSTAAMFYPNTKHSKG